MKELLEAQITEPWTANTQLYHLEPVVHVSARAQMVRVWAVVLFVCSDTFFSHNLSSNLETSYSFCLFLICLAAFTGLDVFLSQTGYPSSACVIAARGLSVFQASVQLAILQGTVPSVPGAARSASRGPSSAESALFREPQQRTAVL